MFHRIWSYQNFHTIYFKKKKKNAFFDFRFSSTYHKSLQEAAERVAAFIETCEDARSWMQDKFDLLEHKVDMNDAKAVQALQKRYQNLGKDLKPLEEKIFYLRQLADEVGWSLEQLGKGSKSIKFLSKLNS